MAQVKVTKPDQRAINSLAAYLTDNGNPRKAFVVYCDGTWNILWRGTTQANGSYIEGDQLKDVDLTATSESSVMPNNRARALNGSGN